MSIAIPCVAMQSHGKNCAWISCKVTQNVFCPRIVFVKVEDMNTMESSDLSAKEFFQLTVSSLLELCTHCIDGHCIVSIEGRLILTLDTGDKVELNILQQDVGSSLKSVKAEETNISSSPSSVCYFLLSADRRWLYFQRCAGRPFQLLDPNL